MNKLTMGSLFDGIGGFVYSGNQVGIDTLWSSEIDPCCETVTKHHFPSVVQLGDITKINGEKVPPVDIICGGSPCQDLSIAGKRAGLAGERSGLYMEQIRIIREMRVATNNTYPRYMVWENVPGALSSNKGDDFRAVLEEAARCAENGVTIPQPKKWSTVGCIVGNGWSIAWRILDAQYFGVPQRRRRIFLVADFGGERAGEILFKPEGLRRNSTKSGETWKGFAAYAERSVDGGGRDGCLTPWDVQSRRVFAVDGAWPALYSGEGGGHGYALIRNEKNVKCLNPHDTQSQRIYDANGIFPALSANENGGQNRQAVIVVQGDIARGAHLGQNGCGYSEDGISYTLNTLDCPAVVFEPKSAFEENWAESSVKNALRAEASKSSHVVVEKTVGVFMAGQGAKARTIGYSENAAPTLKSTNNRKYIIRRLTPLECDRLQGYPDNWSQVPYKEKPMSDSARYRIDGNSVAIPCVVRVLSGIANIHEPNV